VLSYLVRENNYIPWKTVSKHLHDIISVLEYRRSFYPVSSFFNIMMREIESKLDLWNYSDDHTEQLLKEVIIELACKLQDNDCLNNATALWPKALLGFEDDTHHNDIAPHARAVVYNYHFQNTYNVEDYGIVMSYYNFNYDLQEQHRLIEALTYSRLPWLLADFFYSTNGVYFLEFFDVVRMLSNNPLGREMMWDTIRIEYENYLELFGMEDERLGQMIIDVAHTFENEFLFRELVVFISTTPDGASEHARFKALEMASTNFVWLTDKEDEIEAAFLGGHKSEIKLAPRIKLEEDKKSFQVKTAEFMEEKFGKEWKSVLNRKIQH